MYYDHGFWLVAYVMWNYLSISIRLGNFGCLYLGQALAIPMVLLWPFQAKITSTPVLWVVLALAVVYRVR